MKSEEVLGIFKHPLFLLLVGSILSYFIIPAISSISDKERRISEQKLDLAHKIIDQNTEINRDLNSLFVTLELFRKDHEHVSDLDLLNESRQSTHNDMLKLYLHFDSEAWFWGANFIFKSYTSEMDTEDIKNLKNSITKYLQDLIKSTMLIDTIWKSTLRESDFFKPELKDLFVTVRDSLNVLSNKRRQNVKNVVTLLTAYEQ